MTDDERAAREWLAFQATHNYDKTILKHCSTILALLDRPVLPRGADVADDGVVRMCDVAFPDGWGTIDKDNIRAAIDVLSEHLTAPPPKLNPVLACEDALKEAEFDNGYYPERFIKALAAHGYKLVEASDE